MYNVTLKGNSLGDKDWWAFHSDFLALDGHVLQIFLTRNMLLLLKFCLTLSHPAGALSQTHPHSQSMVDSSRSTSSAPKSLASDDHQRAVHAITSKGSFDSLYLSKWN